MGDVKRAARGFVPLARDGHGDEGQTKDLLRDSTDPAPGALEGQTKELLRDSTDPAPGALEGQTKELLRDSTGVAYGFVAAELQARAAGTLQEICTRVNDALRRKGQTPDALFDALAAGGQEVRWPDFRALFAQLEPSLGEGQLQQLWITFDTNADGGISREEFRTQLAKLQALATGVVQTEDQIFDSLADSDHHVTFCAFSAYIAELQPDLEESQHQLLWEQFDKAEDGRVSRDSFVRTLSADQEDEAENNVRRLEAQLMASAGLAFQAESHVRRLERKIKDLEDRQGGGGGKGWGFGGKNPMRLGTATSGTNSRVNVKMR